MDEKQLREIESNFWCQECAHENVRELIAEVRGLRAKLEEAKRALLEASTYDSDEGPCYGMAPCCLMEETKLGDGGGSRDRCRAIRATLARIAASIR